MQSPGGDAGESFRCWGHRAARGEKPLVFPSPRSPRFSAPISMVYPPISIKGCKWNVVLKGFSGVRRQLEASQSTAMPQSASGEANLGAKRLVLGFGLVIKCIEKLERCVGG